MTRLPLRGQRRNGAIDKESIAFHRLPVHPKQAISGSPDEAETIGRCRQAVKRDMDLGQFVGLSSAAHMAIVMRFELKRGTMAVGPYLESSASEYMQVAQAAAKEAAAISRHYYSGNFTVTTKADMTPVTQADVECEQAIRRLVLQNFPDHGFYGEETGRTREGADYLWLVDPIDGTKGFVRQYPFFSTQIALMHRGEIILGVSSGTMMDELAWAEKGCGAWLNGRRLSISEIDDPDLAAVSVGNLKSLAGSAGWSSLGRIVERADRIRGYGDFYHYHLLASGKIEAVIESDVNILDIAALSVIVTEAGGLFTDLNGHKPGIETRSVLAANPALHAVYLESLAGFVA